MPLKTELRFQVFPPKTDSKVLQNKVSSKTEEIFPNRRPATSLANVRLQHDNASSYKASIVQDFLKQKKVVLPHPPHLPDFALCDLFLFPSAKNTFLVEKVQRKNLGSAIFKCLYSIPTCRQDNKNAFKDKKTETLHICWR